MSIPMWLATLAGARRPILEKAPGDVARHAAMGGVLLSTAIVAALSAFFALSTALGLSTPAAAAAAVGWGVIIFNLDRMLVVSMGKENGPWLNLAVAVPRLLLAAVIGSVISMPVVLRIFQPEIDAELVTMQAEAIKDARTENDKVFAVIRLLEDEEGKLQAIIAGRAVTAVTDDPDVQAAQKVVKETDDAYRKANEVAQCEFDGKCGTGVQGNGESYRQKKAVADEAKSTADRAKTAYGDTVATVTKRIQDGSSTDTKAAQDKLPQVQRDLADQRDLRKQLERKGNETAERDTGLLARLEALDRITDGRPSGALAHWMLFLLFLCVELLPVLVKVLLGFGKETLYDQLVKRHDDTSNQSDLISSKIDSDITEAQAQARLTLENQRLAGQADAHATAVRAVAERQKRTALKAIAVWGDLASRRADEELDHWYRKHVGGRQPPAVPVQSTIPLRVPPVNGPSSAPTLRFAPVPGPGPQSSPTLRFAPVAPAGATMPPNHGLAQLPPPSNQNP